MKWWASRTMAAKHMPPKIPVTSTVMWMTAAHYWQIPLWGWCLVMAWVFIAWTNWVMWFASSESIDFDVTVIDSVVESSNAPRTEVMRWAKQLKDK